MASKQMLRDIFSLTVREGLNRQQEDGGVEGVHCGGMLMLPWAICYGQDFPGNSHHMDPRLLKAIVSLGDYNCKTADVHDEWMHFVWMEAMKLIEQQLDSARVEEWKKHFLACAECNMDRCIDMDVFDGGIPNHGIWFHTYVYRVGQLFNVPRYCEMSKLAMDRVIGSQTPDGCWREFQSEALFQGTPVTGYNTVSASAVNLYHAYAGDPKAAEAVQRAWHWFYDFLLPDYSMPPCLDFRQPYSQGLAGFALASWWNIPEGRYIAVRGVQKAVENLSAGHMGSALGFGFFALQYPFIEEEVPERKPAWPEYRRMISEEACIRRRNGWAAVLSGMTNHGNSNMGLRLFALERQDCLSLAHEKTGLLIGSAHSLAEEHFSTFVFYQEGAAHYLPQEAYLKSTPPLDTLLLRYGSNIGAISVDTHHGEYAEITFSLHGERARRSQRGPGHPISAMAARAHMNLRLHFGDKLRLGDREWTVEQNDECILRLNVQKGQGLECGRWRLVCLDAPWEFRWPLRTRNPYDLLEPGEWLGVAEAALYPAVYGFGDPPATGRPSAAFRISLL